MLPHSCTICTCNSDNVVDLIYVMLGSYAENDIKQRTFRKVLACLRVENKILKMHGCAFLHLSQPHLQSSFARADGDEADDFRPENERGKSEFHEQDQCNNSLFGLSVYGLHPVHYF